MTPPFNHRHALTILGVGRVFFAGSRGEMFSAQAVTRRSWSLADARFPVARSGVTEAPRR